VKVGDLVRYRYPETDDEKAIGLVIGMTNHARTFAILELTGEYIGKTQLDGNDMWEVISESR
jgi:hypothetical protein